MGALDEVSLFLQFLAKQVNLSLLSSELRAE